MLEMLQDPSSQVKRSVLSNITRLCLLIGRTTANDELLPHFITLLNNRDWELRAGDYFNVHN